MKILVKDNYFENPDYIRQLALSDTSYRINNSIDGPQGGWKGKRTKPFRLKNTICSCCNQLIQSSSEIDNFISEQSEQVLNLCVDYFDLFEDPLSITSYFHITTKETEHSMPDFLQNKFHVDYNCPIAGLVYLNPNAPLSAGTSILDAKENQFINVENKYNRLVAYDGSIIHGLSELFGNSDDTGRLTFTFFIHEVSKTHLFE